MKNIDLIFLIALTIVASCVIINPQRINGIIKHLIILTGLLALVQLLSGGYYWHYLPSYLLILFMAMISIFLRKRNRKIENRLIKFTLVLLVLGSIAPWMIFLPIPKLTRPQGNYSVGTRIFRWVDLDRSEPVTSDPNDRRNVVVQAWYPSEANIKGVHSSYLDGMNNLPDKIGILPKWIFDHYDRINTYGIMNAPISKVQSQWPVIIFLTGNVAARAFYTSLVAGLASYGYVVLAIDHPYEAMITQLANGEIATTVEVHLKDDPDLSKFMKNRIDIRLADIQFVINQLGNTDELPDNFFSSLDQNRIGIAGHSLGGATAAVAMAVDSRIKAAANIDGTLYGELPKERNMRPFLLLESKKDTSDHFMRYERGNQRLFKQFSGGYRYEILEADHYSFTDAPLLLAWPARFIMSRLIHFGGIPKKTHYATTDILNNFFNGALNDKLFNLDSVANCYPGVIRKPSN